MTDYLSFLLVVVMRIEFLKGPWLSVPNGEVLLRCLVEYVDVECRISKSGLLIARLGIIAVESKDRAIGFATPWGGGNLGRESFQADRDSFKCHSSSDAACVINNHDSDASHV